MSQQEIQEQTIEIQFQDYDTPISLNDKDTIQLLKEKIEELYQISSNISQLFINGQKLDNENPISSIQEQIQQGHKIVIVDTINLQIQYEEENISIPCAPKTKLLRLKTIIEEKTNLPINKQQLMLNNNELKDNLKSLSDYNITPNSILSLNELYQLNIKLNKYIQNQLYMEKLTVKVTKNTTIKEVKQILRSQYDYDLKYVILYNNENDLPYQDDTLLKDLNLFENSTIYLKYSIDVTVKVKQNVEDYSQESEEKLNIVKINFAANDKFEQLYEYLSLNLDIPQEYQNLQHNDIILNANQSFTDLKLQGLNCELTLEKLPVDILIKYKKAPLKVNIFHDQNIKNLKEKLQQLTEIPLEQQTITQSTHHILDNHVKISKLNLQNLNLYQINLSQEWKEDYSQASNYSTIDLALDQVQEMKKAYGNGVSALMVIYNKTNKVIQLKKEKLTSGQWHVRPCFEILPEHFSPSLFVHPQGQPKGVELGLEYTIINQQNINYEISVDIPWQKVWGGDNVFKGSQNVKIQCEDSPKISSPLIHITLLDKTQLDYIDYDGDLEADEDFENIQ